jgi:hypothetical protein
MGENEASPILVVVDLFTIRTRQGLARIVNLKPEQTSCNLTRRLFEHKLNYSLNFLSPYFSTSFANRKFPITS